MSTSKKLLILGGGLSGLGFAWSIKEKCPEMEVEIIEKSSLVGGLATSFVEEEKYYLDFGPHLLTVETEDLLKKINLLLGDDIIKLNRSCLLYFNDRYITYPPSPKNILELGFKTAFLSTFSYLKCRIFPPKDLDTFEGYSKYNFGEYLHKIFFKPYTENFWGMKCEDLASKWADARIAKMSFVKVVLSLLFKSIKNTSIDRDKLPVYYAKNGFGEIANKLANHLTNNFGVNIFVNSNVEEIKILDNEKFEVWCAQKTNRKKYICDILISTIPIKHFVKIINPTPNKKIIDASDELKFRGLLVMHIITKKKPLLKAPYIYYHKRAYHRLTEMTRFSKDLCPEEENILCVEKSCFFGDNFWKLSKEELFEIFISDLEKDGVLKKEDVIKTFLYKNPNVYPVYSHKYSNSLNVINDYLNNISNFKYLGRPGAFLYLDSDQTLERSFKLAEELISNIKK